MGSGKEDKLTREGNIPVICKHVAVGVAGRWVQLGIKLILEAKEGKKRSIIYFVPTMC